jgi:RimJ/RimL family protein N-acetyltransferase
LLLAVTVEDEQPLGEVSITSQAHLAYIIGWQHRGQSLASRALLTAADYAFRMLRTPVLRLEIEPDNHASAAVARRAGFAPSNAPGATVEDKGRTFMLQLWERQREPPGAG